MEAGVRFWTMISVADMAMSMVEGIDYATLDMFANKLVELSNQASNIMIKSKYGTDLSIKVDPSGSMGHDMRGTGTITFMGDGVTRVPPGQCSFGHVKGGIEGILVFDSFIAPPSDVSVLREPVKLTVEKGMIVKIEGGREAERFEEWLTQWEHPAMYEIAHCTYGFNPGVKKVKGNIGYDERVFGSMEFGVGPKWSGAPSHTDGGLLQPSVYLDNTPLEINGKYVHPELVELAEKLGADGYKSKKDHQGEFAAP